MLTNYHPDLLWFDEIDMKSDAEVETLYRAIRKLQPDCVINSRIKGEHLHVDFEDCAMMGFKVFGTGDQGYDGKIEYTVKGKVTAYLQFTQKAPEGIEPVALFPTGLFAAVQVPKPGELAARR